jgi:pyroglutamyl-peptidase
MLRVLITAFEPYDRWTENASWLALLELTKALPEVPRIVTRRYPVDFSRAHQRLSDDLEQNFDFALHVGQAPGSASVRLEAIGLNVGGALDQLPDDYRVLVPGGPTAYQSDLPLSTWASRLRFAGIPANVSYHAGMYLYNALLYLSLHIARSKGYRTRCTFVHLPLAPQQVASSRSNEPSMPSETAALALRLILSEIVKSSEHAALI